MSEREEGRQEGFAAGIEAAAEAAWTTLVELHFKWSVRQDVVNAIRALKPAPGSGEHTTEPSAQSERERLLEAALLKVVEAYEAMVRGADSDEFPPFALTMLEIKAALATAPSTWCPIHEHYKPCVHTAPSPRIEPLPEDPQYDKAGEIPAMNAKEAEFGHLGFRGGWIAGRDWEKARNTRIEAEPVARFRIDEDGEPTLLDAMHSKFGDLPRGSYSVFADDAPPARTPDARSTSDAAVVLPELPLPYMLLQDHIVRDNKHSLCGSALIRLSNEIRAEAAKLTTAPHTADETRVDGGAT